MRRRGRELETPRRHFAWEYVVPEAPPLVREVSDELYKCNRCGFCQTRCPIYRITGLESSVARGHFARLQAVLQDELPFDGAIRDSLFACLMCRACTAECPPAIETDRIVAAARASFVAKHQSRLQKFIFRRLLPNPGALRAAARGLGWLKRTHLAIFSNLLRLLPWFDRGLAEAPALMPTPRSFLRERLGTASALKYRSNRKAGAKRLTYFLGCGIDYALPDVGEASLDLLDAVGYTVTVAPNVCCGLPPYSYGDVESARRLAQQNMKALGAGDEPIVTDCASCSSFLKDYPRLFDEGDTRRSDAEQLASRVRDLTELLASAELPENLQTVQAVVTYHDPCHLSRYHKITVQPRDLLRSIPGVEYRELPEADWCCGGAGSYSLTHHDLSMQILARKMENIRSTGAEIVVTPCPACVMQLRYGASKFRVPIEVLHLAELLRRALPTTYRFSCVTVTAVTQENRLCRRQALR
jgi:glycolate oxidase iron-sulfur subunit